MKLIDIISEDVHYDAEKARTIYKLFRKGHSRCKFMDAQTFNLLIYEFDYEFSETFTVVEKSNLTKKIIMIAPNVVTVFGGHIKNRHHIFDELKKRLIKFNIMLDIDADSINFTSDEERLPDRIED